MTYNIVHTPNRSQMPLSIGALSPFVYRYSVYPNEQNAPINQHDLKMVELLDVRYQLRDHLIHTSTIATVACNSNTSKLPYITKYLNTSIYNITSVCGISVVLNSRSNTEINAHKQ